MLDLSRTALLVLGALLAIPQTHAMAADVSWAGTISMIDTDTGGAVFSDTLGDFSGSFSYGDVCGALCSTHTEPNEADYEFSAPASTWEATDSAATVSGSIVSINIQNDMPLSEDEAELVSQLLETTVVPGTLVDVWTAAGLSESATEEDLTPNDEDDEETLINGHAVEIALLSLDTTLFSDLGFRRSPPSLSEVDLAVFVVREADDQGNTLFDGFGFLTQIPEPSSSLLLVTGALFVAMRRRC